MSSPISPVNPSPKSKGSSFFNREKQITEHQHAAMLTYGLTRHQKLEEYHDGIWGNQSIEDLKIYNAALDKKDSFTRAKISNHNPKINEVHHILKKNEKMAEIVKPQDREKLETMHHQIRNWIRGAIHHGPNKP